MVDSEGTGVPQEVDYALLELKPFDFEAFKEVNERYMKGESYINISATSVMFRMFLNILQKIAAVLQSMNTKAGLMLKHIK